MKFLISLCLIVILVLFNGDRLRKNPLPYYVGAVVLAAASIFILLMPGDIVSGNVILTALKNVLSYISGGAMVGALFTLVMYAGAFVQGGYLAKKFMPVRAQLSILGGILAIGHGIALGQNFLKNLDFSVEFLISLLLLIVMVPLFITSFMFVRKKMKPKTWKRLQRLAYLFYFLTFAHILVFEMPKALRGVKGYPLNVFVYFVVFVSYLFCRIFRAVYKNAKEMMVRAQVISTAAVLSVAVAGSLTAGLIRTGSDEPEVLGEKREASEGVFYGEGMGNNGKIGVNVTVLNGEITDIEIVKFPDDADYFDVEKDGSKMIQQMIESQNPEVDTVSGATFSSEGLIDAVSEALRKAESGDSD